MPRSDTGRWVARAAATGGSRTYRGRLPLRWYGSLVLICLLGVSSVAYSRYELQHPSAGAQPTIGQRWFSALGFDICGTPQPNLPANPNQATANPGIHTSGDGVIQISPTKSSEAGNNATFGLFVSSYPGLEVTSTRLRIPGKPTFSSGGKCPAGTPDAGRKAQVQVKQWPNFAPPGSNHPTLVSDPAGMKLVDGQLITVAFVPEGAAIPKPPADAITTMLQDRSSAAQSTSGHGAPASPTSPPFTPTLSTPAPSTPAPSTPAPSTPAPSPPAPSPPAPSPPAHP